MTIRTQIHNHMHFHLHLPKLRHKPKPAPAVAPNRVIVARRQAAPESFWYTIKAALADVLCNLPIPKMELRRVKDYAPKGLEGQLKPGDVLLRRTEGTSGNLFIPSWWKHAAVYVGDGKIVEATFRGVQESSLDKFFSHGDHVAILRAPSASDTQREGIARYAKLQLGKPYDFNVDFDDDSRVTCTELAYHALIAGTGKAVVGKDWMNAVVGDDFLGGQMELVYTSTPEHTAIAKK